MYSTFSIRLASHADVLRGSSRAPNEPLRTCEASVRHAPTWSAIRHVACRAPEDPFWAGMQEVLPLPDNTTFWIRQLNKYILAIHHERLSYRPLSTVGFLYFFTNLTRAERCLVDWAEVCLLVLVFFLQTQGPPFFAFNQSADSFESYSQKNKGGVPAIRATEYKK